MANAIDLPEISGYIERLFAHEDAVLRELRAASERRGLPAIAITAEVGRLLQVLLTAVGARRVLEIGTLGGYSALWMARALPPDGRLVSLEIEPERAALAREFAGRAGLAEVIEVRVGPALESLSALAGEEPFDACFIDADKESYPAYLRWAQRLVRPGGLVLADNALLGGRVLGSPALGEDEVQAVQDFNRHLAYARDLCATLLPVRDGLAVAVVRRQAG